MKTLQNQEGFAVVLAIMILAMITLLGFASVQTAITEVQITTNMQIHHMEFYAAESGIAVGPLWYTQYHKDNDIDLTTMLADEAMAWSDGDGGTLDNHCEYDFTVSYMNDGTSVYMEAESLMPDLLVYSKGTHPRGGVVPIEATFTFRPIFEMPAAAVIVHSMLKGMANSGTISGIDASLTCDNVPGILPSYGCDESPCIKYGGTLEGNPPEETPTGDIYPLEDLLPNLKARATIVVPSSNNIDVDSIITSETEPGVVFIESPGGKITGLSGYGILVSAGALELAGNLDWEGIILVNGQITFSGGGGLEAKNIVGAVVSTGDAQADLNGSLTVQYNCEVLANMFDEFSGYRMTSWRQM